MWFASDLGTVTVKLGYNDHGYYEFAFITNKIDCSVWSQMTLNYINFHGNHASRTNIGGP